MILGEVFDRFASASAVSVMARGLFEYALPTAGLDALFEQLAQEQYTRELLFSQLVDVMSLVVCRVTPSLNKAIAKRQQELGVTRKAVYAKIARLEPHLGAALVRHTAAALGPVLHELGALPPPWLAGFQVRILDGNHLPGTQHRLKVLRRTRAGALPGQVLVVYDPEQELVVDVIPCEDGHAQERSLSDSILERIREGTVWVADRNFCTTKLLFGMAGRGGTFVIRQHGSTLTEASVGPRRWCGRCPTGTVSEEELVLSDEHGALLQVRRIIVELEEPTRDRETVLRILTNLDEEQADAQRVAQLYKGRWRLEGAFQELECALRGEVDTLGYPKAALFAVQVALAAFNLLSALKSAIRSAHGAEASAPGISTHALATEVASASRGLLIALPPEQWGFVGALTVAGMARWLRDLARKVKLAEYRTSPRGPKKPRPKRRSAAKIKHVSTARLLKKKQE